MNIGIYIYDHAEVLDFSGPFEVFSTANRLGAIDINTFLISESDHPVVARGGFKVLANYSTQNHPKIDWLVVVGGLHQKEMIKEDVIGWLALVADSAELVASVFTGVFLLAKASLPKGLTLTTHWEDIEDLRVQFPGLNVVGDKRWVRSGKYITSGGVSAGIDMSLHLVAMQYGLSFAKKVARQMEYNWSNTNKVQLKS
ncbi:DJ-1/PfpI family protein [Vibrio sp.]|uniref:DJ-1/PfpI family protein n=1 Tax=Vibrio sp. TaxID=678 RepID=UPI00312051B8